MTPRSDAPSAPGLGDNWRRVSRLLIADTGVAPRGAHSGVRLGASPEGSAAAVPGLSA